MYVERLKLKNFKGLAEVDLPFDPNINLIVGINGVGKSTVLDAMRVLLTSLTARIEGVHQKTRRFTNDDIKNGEDSLDADIYMNLSSNKIINWSITRYRKGTTSEIEQSSEFDSLNDFTKPLFEQLKQEETTKSYQTSVPVAVYYNVHRSYKALDNTKSLSTTKVNTTPLSTYEKALEPTGTDFESLEKWFAYRHKWYKKGPNYSSNKPLDSQLKAVQSAIKAFLPHCTDMWFDEEGSNSLHITKNGQDFKLTQMSDGELSLIALVADVARRLAIANPGSQLLTPLHGSGIVMVDEVDLHLHPGWQRMLVEQFRSTFPNCQFFFTTHSPQVIGHVKPKNVWLLREKDKKIYAIRPDRTFGMDANKILDLLMQVPERETSTKLAIEELFNLIHHNKLTKAEDLARKLTEQCGELGDLTRANAMIYRKKLLQGGNVETDN